MYKTSDFCAQNIFLDKYLCYLNILILYKPNMTKSQKVKSVRIDLTSEERDDNCLLVTDKWEEDSIKSSKSTFKYIVITIFWTIIELMMFQKLAH